ncbi:MAG TPA: thiamine phosphate synthase [Xanthobacteraceae bacterium]|jgi:thiamine-phosphate pyrophosphorylase
MAPHVPRLYLVTEPVTDADAVAPSLAAALSEGDIAAVLLRLATADERSLINRIKALASLVQDRDAALILDGYPDLVARSGADGAHLTGPEAFQAALPTLQPGRIVGVGGLHTRHDAMLAGETADYVMFGQPEADTPPPLPVTLERVTWWAEVFQPPCVGYANSLGEVEAIAAAGADFVALGRFVWNHPDGPQAAIRASVQAVAAAFVERVE